MMGIRQQGQMPYKASRRSAKGRLGPESRELTLHGVLVDQISVVHAEQPTISQDRLSGDNSYAKFVRQVQRLIDIVSWEKTVAETSLPNNGL
jgi:hypothetical protein